MDAVYRVPRRCSVAASPRASGDFRPRGGHDGAGFRILSASPSARSLRTHVPRHSGSNPARRAPGALDFPYFRESVRGRTVAAAAAEPPGWPPGKVSLWGARSIPADRLVHPGWNRDPHPLGFTHAGTYPYVHWSLLRQSVDVPVLGTMPVVKLLQDGSTILGLVILSLWLFRWYRVCAPCRHRFRDVLFPGLRNRILAVGIALAVLGGVARALWGIGIPTDHTWRHFTGEVVVTSMALAWWQLVGYGILASKRQR